MTLRRLRITALRCLAQVELELDAERNYFYGPNGAGKTSLLEAIFLLSRGRSFRTRQIRRLVQHGEPGFAVYGEVAQNGVLRRIGLALADGRLTKKVDGSVPEDAGAQAEILPAHVIEPGGHELIQGPPSERRRFLDWGVFHVERPYLEAWRRYRRLLGQRNAALKSGSPGSAQAWSKALAEVGENIHMMRAVYALALADDFSRHASHLLGSSVTLCYWPGWQPDRSFADALAASEQTDQSLGTTTVGPHRADLIVEVHGRKIHEAASRGEQKLAAAALVLAQVEVLSRVGDGGVLLVDDPAAELDSARLGRLLETIATIRAQIIFTALTTVQLAPGGGSGVFHVERGKVTRL